MAEFLEKLEVCPGCSRKWGGHLFSMLASVPLKENDDPQVITFLRAIKNHHWKSVLAFQEWEGGYDNYELFGIRSEDHPMVLVTVRDPFELFYTDRIVETEVLNEIDSREILSLAEDKEWKSSSEIV